MTCSVNHETITTKFCSICGAPKGSAAAAPAAPQWNQPVAQPVAPQWNTPAQPYASQNFQQPQRTNGLAIAGFVTSLVCCGPVGLVLAIMGLNQIKKDPTQGGKGLAIAGIIIGGIGAFFLTIYFFIEFFYALDSGY